MDTGTSRSADFDQADKALSEGLTLAQNEADEIEPDGIPNARNTPIGTVHSNIYYHLGLARFLKGRFADAAKVYEESQSRFAANPDRFVSTAYWQALTYVKLGDTRKLKALLAKVTQDLDVFENQAYHQLLLHFKGVISEAELLKSTTEGNDYPTARYGIAAWRLHKGRTEEAIAILKEVLKGESVYAFGYIAAEAELKRLHQKP